MYNSPSGRCAQIHGLRHRALSPLKCNSNDKNDNKDNDKKAHLTVYYVPETLIMWISVLNPHFMREVLFLF